MIGYVRGKLMAIENDSVLIEVGGIGYEILCTTQAAIDLMSSSGKDVAMWIHTHVREDALQLYGFPTKSEKELFLSLLKVNGVGPKMALGILSGARSNDILDMIENGNAKALSALPRVGKKTAEQIILSLQGKLVRAEPVKGVVHTDAQKLVQNALVNLGFKNQKVEEFVAALPKDIDVEEGVRRGLSALSSAL